MNITVSNETLTYSFTSELSFQAILDALTNASKRKGYVAPQKVYRVIDDGTCILTTTDEVKALRRYYEIVDVNDKINSWVDVEELL